MGLITQIKDSTIFDWQIKIVLGSDFENVGEIEIPKKYSKVLLQIISDIFWNVVIGLGLVQQIGPHNLGWEEERN